MIDEKNNIKNNIDERDLIAEQILGGITSTLGKPINPEHQLIRSDFHLFGDRIMGQKDQFFHTKMRDFITNNKRAVFLLPRGFGKCVHEDTLVYLVSGDIVPIRDIKIGDIVIGINTNYKHCKGTVVEKYQVGEKDSLELIDESGNSLVLSSEHRVLTKLGWTKAVDIQAGDWIATIKSVPEINHGTDIDINTVKLLGYWIAEGTTRCGKYEVTTNDQTHLSEIESIAKDCGWGWHYNSDCRISLKGSGSKKSRPWNVIIRKYGLDNCKSRTKFIPSEILRLSNNDLSIFLSRLYSGDGWVEYRKLKNGKTRRGVGYSTTSELLALQLKILLLRYNIQSNIYKKTQSIKDKPYISYSVMINNMPSILEFGERIGIYGLKGDLLNKLLDEIKLNFNISNNDLIPPIWRKYINIPEFTLRKLGIRIDSHKYNITRDKLRKVNTHIKSDCIENIVNSDIKWEKVKSISQHNKCKMYDITVSNCASFIANGIISHNSNIMSVQLPSFILGNNRDARIIIATNALRLGIEWLREIENIMATNAKYREVFGNLVPEARTSTWTDTEKIVAGRSPSATHTSLYVVSSTGSTLGKRASHILCLHPDQKVITDNGVIAISNAKCGDSVLTACGKFEHITKTMSRQSDGIINSIKVQGFVEPLLVTPEHPLLVESSIGESVNKYRYHNNRRIDSNNLLRVRRDRHGEWKKASDVNVSDYVLLPVNTKVLERDEILRRFDINPSPSKGTNLNKEHLLTTELWRYIGYWIAEGHSNNNRNYLSFNINETHLHNDVADICQKLFNKKVAIYNRDEYNVSTVNFSDSVMAFFVKHFRVNGNKVVPFWVEMLPVELQKELIKGYYLGDGYYDEKHDVYRIISVSLPLLSSVQRMLLRMGIVSLQYKATIQQDTPINGRKIKSVKDKYELRIDSNFGNVVLGKENTNKSKQHKSMAQLSGGYLHLLVRSNESIPYTGLVYNLNVGQGHSFCCTQCATHNCDDIFEPEMGLPSEAQIRRVKEWFWKVLFPVLDPDGCIYVSGCLPADSKIQMSNGTYKNIIDIIPGEEVASFDNGNLVKQTVEVVIPQGTEVVYGIKTARHYLEATANHPFLTVNNGEFKWKRLDELSIGDYLITQKFSVDESKCEFNDDFMWLLGFLFGDGWITETIGKNKPKKGLPYTAKWMSLFCSVSEYEDLNNKVYKLLYLYSGREPRFLKKERYFRVGSIEFCSKLKSLGFIGKAKTKRIPNWIFQIPLHLKIAFLTGFTDADGYKVKRGFNYRIELSNKDLVFDIYRLAMTCGVRPTYPWYRKRFVKPPNSKDYILSETWSTGLTFNDRLIHGYKTKNIGKKIPFRIDKVVSINTVGQKPVYDLSVANTHNFFANGLCVHNTRFHSLDLYGELIDKGWPHLVQQALIPDKSNPTKEVSAWPERFSTQELLNRRDSMGSIIFNLQYQNNADISSRLQLEFLHFVTEDEIPRDLVISQGVDPCLAVGANPDYFAMATVGVSEKTGKGYLLDLVRARVDFVQQMEIIMQQALHWNPRKIGIEANAAQVYMKEALQNAENSPSRMVRQMSRSKVHLPIFPLNHHTSKTNRILEMSAMFESGLVSIKAQKDSSGLVPIPALEPFVSEWLMFPACKNDDSLDSVANALRVTDFGLPPPITTLKEPDLPYYRRRPRLNMFHK